MIVEVMLIVCLNTAERLGCTQLPITDNTQVQDNGAVVNMSGCMGIEGAETAKQYWDAHEELHERYQFGGWSCRIGTKKLPEKGKA